MILSSVLCFKQTPRLLLPRASSYYASYLLQVYDSNWSHLADCSWDVPDLRIAGVVHSGDVTSAPYPDGGRETCKIDIAELIKGFPSARYVALVVYSYTRQEWDVLEDASVFVANPHARGSGPGGMAVIGAARLTGAATISACGYLDLAPLHTTASPTELEDAKEKTKPRAYVSWSAKKMEERKVMEGKRRVHFVFTDQATTILRGGNFARGSSCALGKVLSKMQESRDESSAQTLADAAAFHAAIVCNRVVVLARGRNGDAAAEGTGTESGGGGNSNFCRALPLYFTRGEDEDRFQFYERITLAFQTVNPTAPAVGKDDIDHYSAEVLSGGGFGGVSESKHADSGAAGGGSKHTVFFGGDLDDWLEVTRKFEARKKAFEARKKAFETRVSRGDGEKKVDEAADEEYTLILVNVKSAEKCVKKDEGGITRVNGATAYTELCEAVHGTHGEDGGRRSGAMDVKEV